MISHSNSNEINIVIMLQIRAPQFGVGGLMLELHE